MDSGDAADGRTLLERRREIGVLTEALDGLSGGAGRLLVIEGPAGIGKTQVLAAAAELARARRFAVLSARATELETPFAFGVVRQLFEGPLRAATADQRARLLEGAAGASGSLLLSGLGVPAPELSGVNLLHALFWLTSNLAAMKPLLVVLDDAQWADIPSLRLLGYLSNRMDGLAALLLVSVRSGEQLPDPLVELLAAGRCESLPLAPLTEAGTRLFLQTRLSGLVDDELARACFEATHGNPFLLNELVRTLPSGGLRGRRPYEISVPSVTRSVLRRLERLGPDAEALAAAVALWGAEAELRQAAEVASLELERAGRAADALAVAGIFRPGRPLDFEHPLVRTAVYSHLPAAGRSTGHRQVASILRRESAPPEKVASHLVPTEPSGDESVVVELTAGAESALARGAPDEARRYLERALREPPGPVHMGRVLQRLGAAEMRVDPASAVSHLSAALEAARGDIDMKGRVLLDLVTAHLHAGTVEEAEAVARPVITALQTSNRELALRLEAELLIALRQGLAESPVARTDLDRWKGLTGATPAERLLLSQLAVRAALTGASAADTASLAAAALGGGQLLADMSCDSVTAYVSVYPLLCADRFDDVARYLDRALEDSQERGSPVGFALASTFRSYLKMALGDLAAAEADAQSAIDVVTSFGFPFLLVGPVETALGVLLEAGRFAEADELLQRFDLDGALPDTVPTRILLATRGRLRLAQGNIEKAVEDLEQLFRLEERSGPSNLYLVPYRPWLAAAYTQSGRAEQGRELALEEVGAARAWGAPRILAHNLTAAGRLAPEEDALPLLREAVSIAESSPAKLVLAYAAAELGLGLRRAGKKSEAVDSLRRALDLAHRCGASALAARARGELVLLGARPRRAALTGVEALTAGERRVAEMAASGRSNRQIAEKLFLTTRTVEHHLTHSYQKLGVTSRAGLERFFGQGGAGA
ncbi:MAG TPA: AAA family ATPase [Actinomycetota bacterium]|nr:AAA family ATPase [Actinomycetota bacterium]